MPAKRAKPRSASRRPSARQARQGVEPSPSTVRRPSNEGAIEFAVENGLATATISRPSDSNRLTPTMGRELMDLAETVEDDDSIFALAIAGMGSEFCGGFDDGVDPRLVETLAQISKPTLAILNGAAIDEGLELALALDLRAALSRAPFALTQLQRGILPHFGGTQRLPRLIGSAQAIRMILTGDSIDGAEAKRLGIVTYLAESPDELNRIARDVMNSLASRGPLGMRMVKDAVRKGSDMTLDQGIRLEEDLYALLQTSADRAEGVRAFLEKRKPLFKGA
jgi:enoyl-CoA hydratase/carnithine racemase